MSIGMVQGASCPTGGTANEYGCQFTLSAPGTSQNAHATDTYTHAAFKVDAGYYLRVPSILFAP